MGRPLSDKSIDVLKSIKKLRWELQSIADANSIYNTCELALDMTEVRKCLGELVRRGWVTKIHDTYRFTDKAITKWPEEVRESFYRDEENPMEEDITFTPFSEEPEVIESHPLDEFLQPIYDALHRLKGHRIEVSEADKTTIQAFIIFGERVAKAAGVDHSYACRAIEKLIA